MRAKIRTHQRVIKWVGLIYEQYDVGWRKLNEYSNRTVLVGLCAYSDYWYEIVLIWNAWIT